MDPSNTISIVPSGGTASGSRIDPDSLVSVELEHLGLIPINDPSQFTIRVAGGDDAELAVSVQGKPKIFPEICKFQDFLLFWKKNPEIV